MSTSQPHAKSTTQPKVGFFATLSNPLRGTGTSAPSRGRALFAVLALAIAAFAITAAPASADTVEMGTISNVSYGSAHVTGEVTTTAFFGEYTFEYATSESGPWMGTHEQSPVGDHDYGADLTGLKGGTKYYVRLGASSADTGFSFIYSPEVPPATSYPSFTTLAADPPSVITVDNASAVSYTTAALTGEVNRPTKSDDLTCSFEYITDDAFTANQGASNPGFEGATPAPCEQSPVGTKGPSPVSAKLKDLTNATTYHLRLKVSGAGGEDIKEASTFTTLTVDPPSVESIENAANVEYSGAQVKGVVERPSASDDPALDIISCNFEYVTDAQFKENEEDLSQPGFTGAAQVPCALEPPLELPIHAEGQTPVTASLGNLAASTTYHLRLSATNAGGTGFKDAANTFTTEGPVPKPLVVKTEDATDVGKHSAKVSGEIQRPGGSGDPAFDTSCRFEYVTQAQFEADEFAAAEPNGQRVDCIQAPSYAPLTSPEPPYPAVSAQVSAELTGLPSGPTGITYHLRLTATNGGGSVSKEAAGTFTTLAVIRPTVTIDSVTEVGYTSVRLAGTADPGNQGVNYGLEWSIDPNEGWSGGGARFPQGSGQSGGVSAGSPPAPIAATIPNGLKPGTTYKARLSAFDQEEQADLFSPEPDFEFTTKGTSTPPSTTLQINDVTATTAHLSGSVDAHAPVGPLDEEGKAAYKTDWHFECTPACPPGLHDGTVEAEEGSQAIELDVKHLEANMHYVIKLIAHNSLATVESEQAFDTLGLAPTVTALPGGSDGEGGYTLAGIINPNNSKVTSCEFKWGPDSAAYAFKADCSPPPGEKGQPVTVEAHLTGLNPGSVYHANLFATNAEGTEESKDFEFTPTLADKGPECPNEELRKENGSLKLPECRAFEMVTDPNKQGAGATLYDFNGGDALGYRSGAPNLAGSGQGYLRNAYVATRTPRGWQTIPDLNGPTGSMFGPPYNVSINNGELPLYATDLRSSIWAVSVDGDPAGPHLRRPDGSFVPVGRDLPFSLAASLVGASDDLSHLVANGGPIGNQGGVWGPGVYEFVGTGNDQPRRVDLDNSGAPASDCRFGYGFAALGNAVSTDGRVIVFTIRKGCGGPDPAFEVWARVGGATSYKVSASLCNRPDCNAPADAYYQGAAKDGSRVFFTTTQQLVNGDTDQTNDLYACDIPSGTPVLTDNANPCSSLTRVSGPRSGAEVEESVRANESHAVPDHNFTGVISDDGSTAYFTAEGVLADNEDALEEHAVAGDRNLYVWRTDPANSDGQIAFVGKLPEGDPFQVQTTPDGRYLLLKTVGQLLINDTDESTDVYRYDADIGEMARVSTAVSGVGGNADFNAGLTSVGDSLPIPHNSHPSISDDGQLIVFSSAEPLSPTDGNGEPDAYLWRDGHALGSVAPLHPSLSEGQNNPGQVFIDPSGQDIYIQTAARLNPSDVDFAGDVYDARVGGGFPQRQEGCVGETCQPSVSAPPAAPAPDPRASDNPGAGNPPQPKPCPKGKVRKHGKCVKKHSPKKHHKKKSKDKAHRASHNRGGSK